MVFGTIIRVENQPGKIMSISAWWYDEDHAILYMAFDPGWTIQQWFDIVPRVHAMLDDADGPASAIVDYRRAEDYAPPGIISQLGAMAAAMQHHRLSGLMVFVGCGGLCRCSAGHLLTGVSAGAPGRERRGSRGDHPHPALERVMNFLRLIHA